MKIFFVVFLLLGIVSLQSCASQQDKLWYKTMSRQELAKLRVTEVIHSFGNSSLSPDYSWDAGYRISMDGLSFWRSGLARNLNIGTWKIRSFGEKEKALFKALSIPDVLKVRKLSQGEVTGGGSGYYEVTFSNGKSVCVSNGAGSKFYHPEFIIGPIDTYLRAISGHIPKHISMHTMVVSSVDPFTSKPPSTMSVYRGGDSTHLDEVSKIVLRRIVAYYLYQSQHKILSGITIEGYTGMKGAREYNLALGTHAAIVVRDFLMELGVPASEVDIISFGEDRPACTESMEEECQAQNRRVDIKFR